eukprot:1121033-Pelagomonas_calceolata.AAC.4
MPWTESHALECCCLSVLQAQLLHKNVKLCTYRQSDTMGATVNVARTLSWALLDVVNVQLHVSSAGGSLATLYLASPCLLVSRV